MASLVSLGPLRCFVCGGEIAPTLARLASTRCHDCRDQPALPRAPGILPLGAHENAGRTFRDWLFQQERAA